MMLTESCGCGASTTLEYDPGTEGVSAGARQDFLDEFRSLHAQCRTDERARLVAEAYVPAPSSTYIVNGDGLPAEWPDPGQPWVWGEQDERGETAVGPPITPPEIDDPGDVRLHPLLARRATIGYALDWDPYGPEEVPDSHRLELVADYIARVNERRGVENRVPADLRRMAADLRDSRGSALTSVSEFSEAHAAHHLLTWRVPEGDGFDDDPIVAAMRGQLAAAGARAVGMLVLCAVESVMPDDLADRRRAERLARIIPEANGVGQTPAPPETEREANQRRRAERAEAIVSSLDGWSAGSAPEGRTVWPYTTPSGYVWETPVTYDDLRATATNAALAAIEGAAGNEHAPAPTWDMLGLVFGELAAVVRQVAETLAAGETGSEYHAWHELLAIAEGRSEYVYVLPADVGMSASTLRRIDELRRQAVARIEAERDAD